jgi:hypothetical protein
MRERNPVKAISVQNPAQGARDTTAQLSGNGPGAADGQMKPLFSVDEAGGALPAPGQGSMGMAWPEVAMRLHRQAHPDEPDDIIACRQEPCCHVPIGDFIGWPTAPGGTPHR